MLQCILCVIVCETRSVHAQRDITFHALRPHRSRYTSLRTHATLVVLRPDQCLLWRVSNLIHNDFTYLVPRQLTSPFSTRKLTTFHFVNKKNTATNFNNKLSRYSNDYTSQQDFGARKVYCVSNVTFHAESKYVIKIFPSPTVFVQ